MHACKIFPALLVTPLLHQLGIPNLYLPDAILMSVVIPLANLMNDEETKGIISEEGWYQGVRYLLGVYVEPTEQHREPEVDELPRERSKQLSTVQLSSRSVMNTSTCHQTSLLRRCDSTPTFHFSRESMVMLKQPPLRRNKSHSDLNSIKPDQQQAIRFQKVHRMANQ